MLPEKLLLANVCSEALTIREGPKLLVEREHGKGMRNVERGEADTKLRFVFLFFCFF